MVLAVGVGVGVVVGVDVAAVPLAVGVALPERVAVGVPVPEAVPPGEAVPEGRAVAVCTTPAIEEGGWSLSLALGGSTSSHTATTEPTSSAAREPRNTR